MGRRSSSDAGTITPRVRLVRRFAEFTNQYPWEWTPGELEAFTGELVSGAHPAVQSTIRSYHGALRMFCSFVTDARYGWLDECEQRFGQFPVQIAHEWNTVTHVVDYEGQPGRRALTYGEVQALFDAADARVERIRRRGRKGALAAWRDAAILKTVYAFGLRRREVARLDTVDFRRNPRAAQYGTDGSRPRRYTIDQGNMSNTGGRMTTVELPDGPAAPAIVQALQLLTNRYNRLRRWRDRYGQAFTVRLPRFGTAVMVSDAADVKTVFAASTDLFDQDPNFAQLFGPDALPVLTGDKHRRHRKLLAPPFHRHRMAVYESLVEEEAVREMATWPSGREFGTMPSMMRITLNVILRAVFGAEGAELDKLRALLPRIAFLGSALFTLLSPKGRLSRFAWAPFRTYRRRYDAIVDRLIERALADQRLGERDDVLAMLLQARYDDGSAMSRGEIADELLSLLSAGHESTAATLAWTVERLRRHPGVLRRLVAEADEGGSQLREAVIFEVQRVRPAIDVLLRSIRAESMRLGPWTLPRGQTIMLNIQLVHENEELFPNAHTFDPDRFVGKRPDSFNWIPFGGGPRRCIGAALATMEMNVVLRTLLRDFTLEPTTAPGERIHFRGIACTPARKGLAVVHRRRPSPAVPDAARAPGQASA